MGNFDKITPQTVLKDARIGDSPSGKATVSDSVIREFESLIPSQKKDQVTCDLVFFQLYSPAASSMHFVRDIAFGSYMRFAR